MGYEPGWDEWAHLNLLLDERVSGFDRWFKNFVMVGYGLVAGAGFQVIVGQPGLNVAYVNGYELKQLNAVVLGLAGSATNHIFLRFTKVPDFISGVQAINLLYSVNTTGIPPLDSIKLGEVDTNGVGVVAIRPQNNALKIHGAQLDEDIEGNQYQIKNLVTHKGVAFPTVPAPVSGQRFYRTDLGKEFYFDGFVWVMVGAGGSSTFVEDEFAVGFNGQTLFVLSSPMIAAGLSVMTVNGVVYNEGTHYTIVGATLTWLNVIFFLSTLDGVAAKYQTS
jgi:hypothetical protein